MKLFKKILVANRGEIAARIIRSASELGIRTVAVFSEADRDSLHVEMADESYSIGDIELSDTYLNIDKIINTARCAFCEAIHPGYGFLSENPEFAMACEESGIVFVGPSGKVIELMGNKIRAREFAQKAGVPVIEAITGKDPAELIRKTAKMKLPLLVKAAAGGGGKGMRIVRKAGELKDAIDATSREAMSYFGDKTVYVEKYLDDPRHIEIQIIGDHHGNLVHLFERECSIQRRYQKIIEEAPSPTLTPALRERMSAAALALGRAAGYTNAGTIEFLVDKNLGFYFLEMNTRIQVEHPVTEMSTGTDLVREQILVSAGNPLSFRQDDLKQKGHAIEARIYAEDPASGFMPSPGRMTLYNEPRGVNIRIDSGISGKTEVRGFYDPMIAKLIVHEDDRPQAIRSLELALERYVIQGIQSNLSFLAGIVRHPAFQNNQVSTRFCDENLEDILRQNKERKQLCPLFIPAFAYIIYSLHHNRRNPGECRDVWKLIGYWRLDMKIPLEIDGKHLKVRLCTIHRQHYDFFLEGSRFSVGVKKMTEGKISLEVNQRVYRVYVSEDTSKRAFVSCLGFNFEVIRLDLLPEELLPGESDDSEITSNTLLAPMNGKVIKVSVAEGDQVRRGDSLLIVEAMKMENSLLAPKDAVIEKIFVREGEQVEGRSVMIKFGE